MKFSTMSKVCAAALLGATLSGVSTGVQAGASQDSIFGNVEPALRERMFFRVSFISAGVKTTAKDAYDVTGPVLSRSDLRDADGNDLVSNYFNVDYATAANQLLGPYGSTTSTTRSARTGLLPSSNGGLTNQSLESGCASVAQGLGAPCGLKARGSNRLNTVALSVGYFLDESYKWALEAFVLGAPLKASVYGDGPNGLNGKKIIETKLLPPMVSVGRYFGESKDALRPYVGALASYAVFFDTRATNELNTYQGGRSPGDTSVKINNAFGIGPVVGFRYQPQSGNWFVGMSLGKMRYKTEATLITRNTTITSASQVINDYGAYVTQAIAGGNAIYAQNSPVTANLSGPLPVGYTAGQEVTLTDALMCDVAKNKTGSDSCNLGTYVRKSSTILDNTLFMFSVGHSF